MTNNDFSKEDKKIDMEWRSISTSFRTETGLRHLGI